MSFHTELGTGDIHRIHDQEYADIATRDADTAWNTDTANIGKVVRVIAGTLFFILEDPVPSWLEITTTASTSLNGVLAIGNNTGGTDIVVDTLDKITLTDAPILGTDAANKTYVDDSVAVENLWDRAGTVLSPKTAGDDIVTTGKMGVGTLTPTHVLSVSGATTPRISVISTVGNVETQLLSDSSLGYVGTNTAHAFNFLTNQVIRAKITAAGAFGIGNLAPHAESSLDLGANNKAFMPNRLTTIQRDAIADPQPSMTVYNTDDNELEFYNGTIWEPISGSGDVFGPASAVDLTIAVFDSTTGKLIKEAIGAKVFTDGYLQIQNTSTIVQLAEFIDSVGNGIYFKSVTNGIDISPSVVGGNIHFGSNKAITNTIFNTGNVGIAAATPEGKLQVDGEILVKSGLGNDFVRPTVGITRIDGEIAGVGDNLGSDDGFLRLSAGGGTNIGTKTYIDLSGWSVNPEPLNNIIFGTANAERVRIDSLGRVGIGTKTTTFFLEVESTNVGEGRISVNEAGVTGLNTPGFMIHNEGVFKGGIFYKEATDLIEIHNNGGPIIEIDTNGGVDINGKVASRLTSTVHEIFVPSDLDSYTSGGVITLPSGSYFFMEDMTLTDRIELESGATVDFQCPGVPLTNVTYSGTGTFITSASATRISLFWAQFTCTGTGAQVFDITGAAFTMEKSLINMSGTGTSLGNIDNSTAVTFRNSTISGFYDGITITNPFFLSLESVFVLPEITSSGTSWIIKGTSAIGAVVDGGAAIVGPTGSLFYFDPIFTAPITVQNAINAGPGNFFQPETDSGAITSIVDHNKPSYAVDTVQDATPEAGSQFLTTVFPNNIEIGDTVIHTGFTNSSYNGTFVVTDKTGSAAYTIGAITFISTDTGTVVDEEQLVELVVASHSVIAGDSINVVDTINYNGGYTVVSQDATGIYVQAVFVISESTGFYNDASLDESNKYVDVFKSGNQKDSKVTAEAFLIGNSTNTIVPAVDALVIPTATTWTGEQEELLTVQANGVVRNDGLKITPLTVSASLLLEPTTATKIIQVRLGGVHEPPRTVTFTNGTNLINETSTPRVDGDIISFLGNAGTLPAELREDIFYYVVSKATNSFQVAYTSGGTAITFTDDGSGTNTYRNAGLHGSRPRASIGSGSPIDLECEALVQGAPDDEVVVLISNLTDAVNILCSEGYSRLIGS